MNSLVKQLWRRDQPCFQLPHPDSQRREDVLDIIAGVRYWASTGVGAGRGVGLDVGMMA